MSLILRIVAVVLFILAGVTEGVAGETNVELVAWGLAAWCLATLLGDVDVPIAVRRREP